MSSYIGYDAQQSANEIQTDNASTFVIRSQVVADASSSNVTYNMSVTEMTPSDQSAIKYDYVFDYELNETAAASFCNAFTVTGADAYSSSKNTSDTSVTLSAPNDVKSILLSAFANATAEANQAPASGAPTLGNLSGSDTIDSTLTSILRQFVHAYDATSFDSQYYSAAIGSQSGVSTDEVSIALDDNDTGVSALKRANAAEAAVSASGAIVADATLLALQIPASNMRLYEDPTSSVLPTALLLKKSDTVVLGFQVTLDNPQATCTLSSGDATNSGAAVNTHPAQLEAASLDVDVAVGPSAIRPVEIAIRLKMANGSGKISGVRAPPS
jgi:hypothetical protein